MNYYLTEITDKSVKFSIWTLNMGDHFYEND